MLRNQAEEDRKAIDMEQKQDRDRGAGPGAEEKKVGQLAETPGEWSLKIYWQVLRQAWSDAKISQDEADILSLLRNSLGVEQRDHESLQRKAQMEVYLQAVTDAWKEGGITPQGSEKLDLLRGQFSISAEQHLLLQKRVANEILKQSSKSVDSTSSSH
jgi:hypothetical protein